MFELIVVIGIVAIVGVLAVRSFYRTITGKNDGCGCSGNCRSCSCADIPDRHQALDIMK